MDLRPVVRVLLLATACTERNPGGQPAETPPSVRYDQQVFAAENPASNVPLKNPTAGEAKSAQEGEQLFASMNCDGCHGGGAVGFVGPSLTDGRWRYGATDAAIFQSIYYGRPNGMPAFGKLLSPEVVWKLVTYLQSLSPPKAVPTQSW